MAIKAGKRNLDLPMPVSQLAADWVREDHF
jgi:hypothetical protein